MNGFVTAAKAFGSKDQGKQLYLNPRDAILIPIPTDNGPQIYAERVIDVLNTNMASLIQVGNTEVQTVNTILGVIREGLRVPTTLRAIIAKARESGDANAIKTLIAGVQAILEEVEAVDASKEVTNTSVVGIHGKH